MGLVDESIERRFAAEQRVDRGVVADVVPAVAAGRAVDR